MLVPTKFTSLNESIIYKMIFILDTNQVHESIMDAFRRTKEHFKDVGEFQLALCVLYALNKIEVNENSNSIIYADTD